MTNNFLSLIFALLGAVFYSLNQIFNKKVVLAIGTLPAVSVNFFFLTVFDFIFCYLFENRNIDLCLFSPFSKNPDLLKEFLLLSVVGTLASLSLYESFKHLPLGVSITLANLSPLFVTLFVFLFEGVLPPLGKLITVFLILFAVYLVVSPSEGKRNYSYHSFAWVLPLITAVGWGFFGWEIYRIVQYYHLSPFVVAFYTSLFMWLIFMLLNILDWKSFIHELKKFFKFKKLLWWSLAGSLLTSLGFITSTVAYRWAQAQDVPIIEAVLSLSTPLSALFSYLLLGEKLHKRQWVGIILSFVGLLVFFLS
ncbi:MAG: DMT family transporter [Aquificota bacterium]|jgi:drug/metabolite transporter (DMT)-like permease